MGEITDIKQDASDFKEMQLLSEQCPAYHRILSNHINNSLVGIIDSCERATVCFDTPGNTEEIRNNLHRIKVFGEHMKNDLAKMGIGV